MEPNEPILLPPFSQEDALKRDVSEELFALYRDRVLPTASSDEEVIDRIKQAYTVAEIPDPAKDNEWKKHLFDKKKQKLYTNPRYRIYKIIRDERSEDLYRGRPDPVGSYLFFVYNTENDEITDELGLFPFLLHYYKGIKRFGGREFLRNHLMIIWQVNIQKASLQYYFIKARLPFMTAAELFIPDKGIRVSVTRKAAEKLQTYISSKTEEVIADFSDRPSAKYEFRFTDGENTLLFSGDEEGLFCTDHVFLKPAPGSFRWPTFFRRLRKEIPEIEVPEKPE